MAAGHLDNLKNQHMRYMWIPHTDAVVVVASNPLLEGAPTPPLPKPAYTEAEMTQPLRELVDSALHPGPSEGSDRASAPRSAA